VLRCAVLIIISLPALSVQTLHPPTPPLHPPPPPLPPPLPRRFVTDTLKGALPGAAAALPDGPPAPTSETIDASKLRQQLGVELRPARDTLVDAARSLLQHGVARPGWFRGEGAVPAA